VLNIEAIGSGGSPAVTAMGMIKYCRNGDLKIAPFEATDNGSDQIRILLQGSAEARMYWNGYTTPWSAATLCTTLP